MIPVSAADAVLTTPAQRPTTSETAEFLAAFFAAPNGIALSDITSTGKAAHLIPWVERLRKGDVPLPTVLPCRRDDRVYWYGLAFSDAQLRALGDQLLAFVGPTHSTFRGHRAVLEPADPIDGAVERLTEGFAFKFSGPRGSDKPKPVWDALELMRTVMERRPDRVLDAPRATGRVLRDFYMALRARNAASAEAALRYLTEQRRLTPGNILFLRVQALAELGEWDALLARPELRDLLEMRRPLVVTEAVLRAVYQRELASFEQAGDADGAVARFRTTVLPDYGVLLLRRAGMRSPEALKALMLAAVAGEPPDPDLRDAVWNTRGLREEDRLYLKLLADRIPVTSRVPESGGDTTPLQRALEAHDRGDYESAYALALSAPSSVARARLLIESAYEIQTLDAEREAVLAVGALASEERTALLRGRRLREMYQTVSGVDLATREAETRLVEPIPENWIQWLERLAREAGWAGALNVARRGAVEWNVDDLLAFPNAIGRITDFLNSLGENVALQNALPHLVTFFERDALWPRPEAAPVYDTILELLAIGTNGAEDDVRVYVEMMEGVLELGVEQRAYRQLLSELHHLLTDASSPGHLVWGLEALEATVAHPCPDEDARLSLLLDVASLANKYWRRVDGGQRTALRLLCHDLGHPEVFASVVPSSPPLGDPSSSPPSDVLARLNGKSVAIYTLTERAGRYMQQILAERAPNATVHLAHDKVASENLRHLARRADVFIMATASAKHAATEFIQANRPADRPLLRPGGKGMASMLYALEEFLNNDSSEEPLAVAS